MNVIVKNPANHDIIQRADDRAMETLGHLNALLGLPGDRCVIEDWQDEIDEAVAAYKRAVRRLIRARDIDNQGFTCDRHAILGPAKREYVTLEPRR